MKRLVLVLAFAAIAASAFAECSPAGFDSAIRVADAKLVRPYLDIIRYQQSRAAAMPFLDPYFAFSPAHSKDGRNLETEADVVARRLRFRNARVWVDVFIDASGSARGVCCAGGDEILMGLVDGARWDYDFSRASHGQPVVVRLSFDFHWRTELFRPGTSPTPAWEMYVSPP